MKSVLWSVKDAHTNCCAKSNCYCTIINLGSVCLLAPLRSICCALTTLPCMCVWRVAVWMWWKGSSAQTDLRSASVKYCLAWVTMEVHRYSMQWRNLGFNISLFQMAYKLAIISEGIQTSQSENIRTKSKDTQTKHWEEGRLKHFSFGQAKYSEGIIAATSVLDWKTDWGITEKTFSHSNTQLYCVAICLLTYS